MMALLLKLFWSFFQIGLFSIGGGYAALPLIQKQMVDVNGWLTLPEFVDLVTISQMTPGPIALNAATFAGTRVAGIAGSIVATLGCVTPSCIIVLTIGYFYSKYKNIWPVKGAIDGLKPAVVALIAYAGLSILLMALFGGRITKLAQITASAVDPAAAAVFAAGLFVMLKFKPSPIYVMLGAGLIGLFIYGIF